MVRIGINLRREGASYESLKRLAQLSETLGFDSLWTFDHLMSSGGVTKEDILECLVTMSALARDTKRIRLGALVLCNLFRHPAMLAKMTSALDVISGGRLDVGVGIGGPSTPPELFAYGLSGYPRRRERIRRLEEAIIILKSMWTLDEATFEGKYYSVKGAINYPKPVQKPYPPIWIGGEAEDIIELTAMYADGWNCRNLNLDVLKAKINLLNEKCVQAGRRPESVQRSWSGVIFTAKSREELDRKLASDDWKKGRQKRGLGPGAIIGTLEECTEKLRRYGDLGIDLMILSFVGADDETITMFADKVVNNLT
ncbi:MAG: LLM class flavin-dependent oxidoreductase [Candidatus Bathyarchaeota archaeon]